MSTDARRLLAGLEDYAAALERHFAELRDRHASLEAAWLPTRETYQGTGAEVFADAFGQADARFNDYLDGGARILAMLNQKIAQLRRFDSPTDPDL